MQYRKLIEFWLVDFANTSSTLCAFVVSFPPKLPHPHEPLVLLPLVEGLEVIFEVEVSRALAVVNKADVGGGGGLEEEALVLKGVEAAPLAASMEDPAREVHKAIGVSVARIRDGDRRGLKELDDSAEGAGRRS
ncbi:uncharacterized protein A4U43_UnF6090 [Asparagus officinalis]|uniref:Uncharacterized protein n=1 Tax=Asparagus officinalis TaxID=4686 RepID=A0A1R3L6J4_ASPOF|nr:uncharacterized protein A4U43_UnF6090 [Asparagus officinalis]